MKISILQYDIQWMDIEANLKTITAHLDAIQDGIDLLVLPEMFLSGFNMDAATASIPETHRAIEALTCIAEKYNTGLVGSLAIAEDDQYFNRVLLVTGDGIIGRYDKQYLFSPSGEDKNFTQKYPTALFDYKGWNILPQVCYDLRFPENVRSVDSADLIVYMANWPAGRIQHWDALLKARAIENQCYTIGCNRIGKDKNGWSFPGHSQIVNPKGTVSRIDENQINLLGHFDIDKLREYRIRYPFWKDKK